MSEINALYAPRSTTASRRVEPRVATSLSKRAVDLLAAIFALLLLLPILVMTALAVKLDSPGPMLFRQRRTGLGGQTFHIYKFRTMRVAEDGADLQQATRGDSRITRVGGFLRRSSLDELPQLLNVLKGDMSIVGPRPHALAHDALFSQQVTEYPARFAARPGLTGLAQIRGHRGEVRSVESIRRRVAADVDYIRDWSLGMDVKIIFQTVPLIFRDDNAY